MFNRKRLAATAWFILLLAWPVAYAGLEDFDLDPNVNSTVGGVSVIEGMSPAGVNDSIRGLAAELRAFADDLGGANTTTGSANAHILATDMGFSALEAGDMVAFEAGFTNTAATTLNVDGRGAHNLNKYTSAGLVALGASDIRVGGRYIAQWEPTGSDWILLNPTNGTAAYQDTGTSGANVPLLSTANTWTTTQSVGGSVPNFTAADDGVSVFSTGVVNISGNDISPLNLRRRLGDGAIVSFYRSTAAVGTISITATATAYNTSSDQRLKENFRSIPDLGAVIDAVQMYEFDWKSGEGEGVGPKAQELYEHIPAAVYVGGDDPATSPWGYDPSKLVPYLWEEVKALRARVAALEAQP